jgi:predicted peptidase
MKKLLFFLIVVTIPFALSAQDLSLFQKAAFTRAGKTIQYRVLYPLNYNKSKKYPVITFLHGSGERGNDNESQLTHGGALFVNDTVRKMLDAIVIFPQLPGDSLWRYMKVSTDSSSITGHSFDLTYSPVSTTSAHLVKLLLDSLISSKVADKKRMYIAGLSLGGFGTFDMIERYPDFFAAAAPICGGGDTKMAPRFAKKMGVWLFHGDADKSVDVKNSRQYYAVLKNLNADVKYTEYPGVGHNSWDNAFKEKALLPWLLSHNKK